VVIWESPVEYARLLSHHEEHEDHKGSREKIKNPSSCSSWLK
jgi:hypothetical protein